MKVNFHLTLKLKLMLLLVTVTTAVLGVFAYFALMDFKHDKIAYVFDSTRAHVRSTAGQVRSELSFHAQQINSFLINNEFPSQTDLDSPYRFLQVYRYNKEKKKYDIDKFHRKGKDHYQLDTTLQGTTLKEAMEEDFSIHLLNDNEWLLGAKFGEGKSTTLVTAVIESASFFNSFLGMQPQNTYLVNHLRKTVISASDPAFDLSDQDLNSSVDYIFTNQKSNEGVYEYSSDSETLLLAVSQVGIGDLRVISIVPKRAALEAVYSLITKGLLIILFLMFAVVSISILGAHRLTSSLRRLLGATKKVKDGDFEVEVEVKTKDEVGQLANGFNQMTGEIKRLMGETAEKARMEEELKTAQLVQSTLFPQWNFDNDILKIRGYYEPASECSGDWWHYMEVGDKFYMVIGDATGHGVSAALVTSATKSATTIIERFPDLEITTIMEILNESVYATTGGTVNMTFFVGCLDKTTGKFSYCNASHDPPFLLQKECSPLKKKDIKPLFGKTGKRLGEESNSSYQQESCDLKPGDRIIFYTDGVTELIGPDGKLWGERPLVRCLLKSFNDDSGLDVAMEQLQSELTDFRQQAKLEDDITYFMFEYNKAG